jgi:hypothetical protein
MAIPGHDFDQISSNHTFERKDQYIIKFNLSLMTRFKADYDLEQESETANLNQAYNLTFTKKFLFLYLDNPNNGLRLVEPSNLTFFSPYIKIEVRKFSFKGENITKEQLQVGFSRRSLNQTVFIQNNSTITHFVFFLNSNRSIINPMVIHFFSSLIYF